MIKLDKEYRYRGINPRISKGKVGNITGIIDEIFVEFTVFEPGEGGGFVAFRVKFSSLEIIDG